MFSYYGTKKKLAPNYPAPSYDTIIEPFAGAGMYSLHGDNWEKNVILNDKYDKVYQAWNYLINMATISDIKNLPELTLGLKLDTLNITESEKSLLGFYANPASSVPKKTVTKRGEIAWERNKKYLIENLHKVKHWKITNQSFEELENIKATWYIDPPYEKMGIYYRHSSNKINYSDLGEWCKNRKGEIIVCENIGATWLEFKPLVKLMGQTNKLTTEMIYYKNNNEKIL